jgi:hypothetical protein
MAFTASRICFQWRVKAYSVPQEELPATFIDCKDKKEAAKMVLLYSSTLRPHHKFRLCRLPERCTNWTRVHLAHGSLLFPGIRDFDEFIGLNDQTEEDEYEIPAHIETDIQEGDFFEIGPHRLLVRRLHQGSGGSESSLQTGGKLFDIVVTDPPYNVDYEGSDGQKIMNDQMEDDAFYEFLLNFYTAFCCSGPNQVAAWYVWHADSEGLNFRQSVR